MLHVCQNIARQIAQRHSAEETASALHEGACVEILGLQPELAGVR